MQHKTVFALLCGIALLAAACTPSIPAMPTNTLPPLAATVPPPTATSQPPTATSGPPTPTPLPPEVVADIQSWFEDMGENSLFSGAVLIAQHGNVLLSQGYGMADREKNIPNTAQTRFRIGSLTKQFTAMAILILESQGKLNVQDSICDYIADCPTAWEAITIHHLLTHTAGITNFTGLPDYMRSRATPSAPLETIARFKDLPLDFQPGEKWNYSNSGYVVLGYIIEQVAGQSYENFLQASIFTPLDLGDTGYDHNSDGLAVGYNDQDSSLPADFIDMSIPYAAGALYSTVEDLYKWGQSLYTEQLVTQPYLDRMFAPHVFLPNSQVNAYGYGWMTWEGPNRRASLHYGGIEGFASFIVRYLDDQITIIMLSNHANTNLGTIMEILYKKIYGEE